MRAGIQPGGTATHEFDLQVARLKVEAIDVGYFKFTTRLRLEILGQLDDT